MRSRRKAFLALWPQRNLLPWTADKIPAEESSSPTTFQAQRPTCWLPAEGTSLISDYTSGCNLCLHPVPTYHWWKLLQSITPFDSLFQLAPTHSQNSESLSVFPLHTSEKSFASVWWWGLLPSWNLETLLQVSFLYPEPVPVLCFSSHLCFLTPGPSLSVACFVLFGLYYLVCN